MKLAYTNLRVGDLDKSLDFYQNVLGMSLHRTAENPEYRYTLAWLGFSDYKNFCQNGSAGIELTYNWDTQSYDLGEGFGQIVIAVKDVYQTSKAIKAKGWPMIREAGPVKGGNTVIAFLADPDGYRIELVETYRPDSVF